MQPSLSTRRGRAVRTLRHHAGDPVSVPASDSIINIFGVFNFCYFLGQDNPHYNII